MGGTNDALIDLSDLDTADVSWLSNDEAGLYSLAPVQGVAVVQQAGGGKGGGGGGGCWTSRPATPWGPFCH